ncbi:MAG: capsule assembly Wzi family protein, partial [Chitinophagaceae bacterium]
MKLIFFRREIAVGVSLFISVSLAAQQLSVSPLSLEEDLRYLQLKGQLSADVSLTVRPTMPEKRFTLDSFYQRMGFETNEENRWSRLNFLGKAGKWRVLPTTAVVKMNTRHPYGWSDGALMPVAGAQTLISTGLYLQLGPLVIQAKPEYLYAANPTYPTTLYFGAKSERPAVKRFFPGQSKIELGAGPVAVALSSENLWWGPGQHSSLMMTNNAPGFYHLRFNSRRPLRTAIGNFEWNLIAGRLEDEAAQPDEILQLNYYGDIYGWNKPYWKYINAIVLSYQPSFLKGLSLGATRSFTSSGTNVTDSLVKNEGVFRAYLPVFADFFKSRLVNEDQRQWNQLVSFFMRQLFQKANAEIYFEYGWNDHKYNIRDLIMSPFHSASYMAGYKKLFRLSKNRWLELSGELTQMEQSPDYLVRGAGNWYVHWFNSNYSHYGQILGSGIGYGSNSLITTATLRKGPNFLGFVFERVQRDPNVHTERWTD